MKFLNKIIKSPLVLLEWEDSAQPRSNWGFVSDLENPEIIKCASVGWLISDGDNVKALAPNIGHYNSAEDLQASGVICIPSRSVIRVTILKEGE